MIFDLIGGIVEWAIDAVGELISSGGSELIAGATELAAEIGTAVVAIGAGAAALGAIIALAELSVDSIRKVLYNKKVASEIENILNNDENTLKSFLPSERLQGANKYNISQMKKVVNSIKKTSDGQTVATVRIIHPHSGVYVDAPIAGNKVNGIYEGMTI